MDTILSATGIEKRYPGGNREVRAVASLDLELREGEFLVLMGRSGSGKSTLLYLLSGLERLSSGSLRFRGRRLDGEDERGLAAYRRAHCGFVFQNVHLLPTLSLEQNVLIQARLRLASPAAAARETARLLEGVGLAGLADRLPARVSGGQQQRAAIARALAGGPDIVFADEPTGNLDRASGSEALDLLKSANDSGQTVVLVTHDPVAACYGRRVVLLRDGSVSGSLELSAAAPGARLAELGSWLDKAGW